MNALAACRWAVWVGSALGGLAGLGFTLLGMTVLGSPLRAAEPPTPALLAADSPETVRYHAGDFVVVTRRTELKVENSAVDTVDEGLLMGVDRVDGDWLWVTNKKSGWLHRSAVIPAKQAVDMFTAALRRHAGRRPAVCPARAGPSAEPGLCRRPERLQRSLAAAPGEAVYYGDRGCIRLALGDADQAIADFREEARRIDSEEESRRAIRLEWLEQRVADAEATKAGETAVTLEGKP